MPHDPNFAWTVGELNRYAQSVVKEHLGDTIWLCGELGRIQPNTSGHVYGVLKDEQGNSINIAYFGGARKIAPLKLAPGACVLVKGNLDLYVVTGSYQFIVRELLPANAQGGLMERYLETRKRLSAEGLFAPERKRPLPLWPKCVAVITSPSGAALQDFLKTAYSRMPNLHLRIIPSPMQGQGTAIKVASAVQCLNAWKACDVIVITRGGGSMEDLWEFNDEALARVVASSEIPVVSAVGHQIDVTMLDYVADVSVITPTQAANAVTEGVLQLATALEQSTQRLPRAMRHLLDTARLRFTRAASCAYLQRPQVLHGRRVGDEATLMLAAATLKVRLAGTVPAGNVYLAQGYQLRIHAVGHHAHLLAVFLLVERRLRLAVGTAGQNVGNLAHLPHVEVVMPAQVQQLVAHAQTLRVAPAAAEGVVDVPLAAFRRPSFRLHEHGCKGRHSV